MTAPNASLRRLAVALALVVCAGLALSTAATAATKLTWKKAKAERLIGTGPDGHAYAADQIVWLECKGRATAILSAWTGPKAPIAIVYSHLVKSDRMMGLAVRKPMRSGAFRARTLCLGGARAVNRERSGGTVSCSRRQLAIGVPIDGGPYWTQPVSSRPVGARGWRIDGEGTYGRSKAICVPAKAFRKVARVRRAATFPAGKATATVRAACKGGRRPISWGFEVGALEDNIWRSPVSDTWMTVPFISASMPKGKAGWRLTFATPDGAPARTSTPLALHLTCAVPR